MVQFKTWWFLVLTLMESTRSSTRNRRLKSQMVLLSLARTTSLYLWTQSSDSATSWSRNSLWGQETPAHFTSKNNMSDSATCRYWIRSAKIKAGDQVKGQFSSSQDSRETSEGGKFQRVKMLNESIKQVRDCGGRVCSCSWSFTARLTMYRPFYSGKSKSAIRAGKRQCRNLKHATPQLCFKTFTQIDWLKPRSFIMVSHITVSYTGAFYAFYWGLQGQQCRLQGCFCPLPLANTFNL